MTDILLDSVNDLFISGGQISLITDVETLTRQRLLNKLRTFTNTLFTNINYGVDVNLVFERGTKALLDQHIKTLISETDGVVELLEYESVVGTDRVYRCQWKYKITTGEIVGIRGLSLSTGSLPAEIKRGIWKDGYWDYSGDWDDLEIWGGGYGDAPTYTISFDGDLIVFDGNPLLFNL